MADQEKSEGKRDDVIELQLAPSEREYTPGERKVFEESIAATARHVRRRLHHNMSFATASERAERLQAAVKRIDAKQLREMIEGDLECDEKHWGPNASGTASLIDRHLGIEPRLPREKLKSLDLESPTLVQDVLALAVGAYQDVGFSLVQKTPEGEKTTSFAELDLTHLNATLAQKPE